MDTFETWLTRIWRPTLTTHGAEKIAEMVVGFHFRRGDSDGHFIMEIVEILNQQHVLYFLSDNSACANQAVDSLTMIFKWNQTFDILDKRYL